MANTGVKGIDVVQTGTAIIFRAFLLNASGQLVTSGGTNLLLYEMQSDGSLKSYDFSSNTFKTTTLTTESVTMTHQTGNAGATNTGVWTYALSTLTGFTVGAVYLFRVNNTTAAPNDQWREFQYGGDQGDLLVTQGSTGQAYLQADVEEWVGAAPDALSSGLVQATLGGTPNVNVTEWGGSAVTGMPMPTYTQPTGFLAATFPTTVASPTNITAGTITTVTNLTNAPTSGDFTATMKTSIGTAVAASAVASVTGNVNGNVVGSVGSISGVTFPTNFGALSISVGGHITNVDTLTTYTGNTPQTGDSYARIGSTGSGLTSLAPAATALSTATWTATRAGYLDNLSGGAVCLAGSAPSWYAAPTTPPTVAAIVAGVFSHLIDTTYTFGQYVEAIGATTAGADSGAPGTPAFKSLDGLTVYVTSTADSNGNRTVAYNL